MKRHAPLLYLAVMLLPLGCPLLLEDDFVLVDAQPVGGAGAATTDRTDGAGAPAAPPCPPECDSCDSAACILRCQGEGACKERALKCPAGRECHIACSGKEACLKVHLTCPTALPCSIECADDKDACKDMVAACGSGRCEAQCYGAARVTPLTCAISEDCRVCP
jgi:hypothetical protein